MRLSFRVPSRQPAVRLLQLGLVTIGALAASMVLNPQSAHALEIELFFPDRTTINLDNPNVSPQDFQGLSETEREGLGVSNEAELQALITRAFNDTAAKDSNIWDNEEIYELAVEGCTSVIDDIEPGKSTADVTLSLRYNREGEQGCAEITRNDWPIRNPDHVTAAFSWVDAATIEPVQGGGVSGLFVRSTTNTNQFLRQNEDGDSCQDYIQVTDDMHGRFFQLRGSGGRCAPSDFSGVEVFLLKSGNRSIAAGEGAASPDGGAAAEEDEDTSCEESGVLTWFLCPVIKTLDTATETLDNQIQALLTIPENDYTSPELRTIWARMRNIAYIILVPIMLVMVISTALGFEFVSAYTVKRALPRLIIAIIFIAFSWNIMIFLITLTNNVGNGILGLMTSAFASQNGPITLASLFDGGAVGHIFEMMVTGGSIAAGVLVAKTAPGLILLLAGLIVLALLVGFVVLTLRQLLILALVMVSPLAILAWIFPGNDKLWKIWWQSFSKLLMMFPLLMLVIGAGRVLALVVSQTRTDFADSLVGVFFKLLAYIIPYFFIFTIIKLLSPLLNSLSGGVFSLQQRAQAGLTARYAERGKDQLKGRTLASRERIQNWADKKKDLSLAESDKSRFNVGGRVFRGAMKGVSKGAGGYNLQAELSARRAAKNKEIGDQSATGDDTEIRASVTDGNLVNASRGGVGALERAGYEAGEDYQIQDGRLQLKNISGNWYDASKAQAGQDRWGKDQHAMQKNVSYEMYKAATEEEAGNITQNFPALSRSLGFNDAQAGGMWTGAAYENQNRLEYKHTKLKNGRMVLDGAGLAKEIHEKKGTYDVSKMGSSTVDAMRAAHDQAVGRELRAQAALEAAGDDDDAARDAQNKINEAQVTQQRIKDTAATLTARMSSTRQQGESEDGQPITGGGGGPAHVEQRIQELNAYVNGGGANGAAGGGGGGGGRRNGPPQGNGGIRPPDVGGQRAA